MRVAREGSTRRIHLDRSAARTRRHGRGDLVSRDDLEGCRNSVEAYVGRSVQVGPENRDASSDLAGSGDGLHKRTQANSQPVERSVVLGAAELGYSVQVPVRALRGPGKRKVHRSSRSCAALSPFLEL